MSEYEIPKLPYLNQPDFKVKYPIFVDSTGKPEAWLMIYEKDGFDYIHIIDSKTTESGYHIGVSYKQFFDKELTQVDVYNAKMNFMGFLLQEDGFVESFNPK